MVREFHRQSQRLELLSRYKALLVYSPHLHREFARHGLEATCIGPPNDCEALPAVDSVDRNRADACRLLFVGRMDRLKGGGYLLDALPRVAAAVGRPMTLTFAGDGPARSSWEAAAARVTRRRPALRIEFAGWLDRGGIAACLARADVLVVPSLWPEPFGLVGLEAARRGLPVAAFAVGGIRDWLRPGVNGCLAPGDPPTPGGLADAIIACVQDPGTYARLCDGARRVAAESSLRSHVEALVRVLEHAAGASSAAGEREVAHVQRP